MTIKKKKKRNLYKNGHFVDYIFRGPTVGTDGMLSTYSTSFSSCLLCSVNPGPWDLPSFFSETSTSFQLLIIWISVNQNLNLLIHWIITSCSRYSWEICLSESSFMAQVSWGSPSGRQPYPDKENGSWWRAAGWPQQRSVWLQRSLTAPSSCASFQNLICAFI